jgi:NTP pyrophosphatase (non-canonical NTP hydrolase)
MEAELKVFIVMENGISPKKVCWTREAAEIKRAAKESSIVEVELEPVTELVKAYFKHRKYKTPDQSQAMLFLTSELGELADEVVHSMSPDWVRNNPDAKGNKMRFEFGDVLMMLVATWMATYSDGDPIEAMVEKFKTKQFPADPDSTRL